MRCRIRQKTYVCGDYRHVFIYPVFSEQKRGHRRKKFRPTSEAQKQLNDKRAQLWLNMLLEANFDDKDFFFTCTYKPGEHPLTDTDALKNAKNFIRRVQYQCKKRGLPEPVALWCTERGSRSGLYHHHFVIKSGLTAKELAEIWGRGRADVKRLYFDGNGLKGLAKYLPKDPIGDRRYHSTRNLKKPAEQTNDSMSQKQYSKIAELAHFENTRELEKQFSDYFISRDNVTAYESLLGQYVYIKLYKKNSKYIT